MSKHNQNQNHNQPPKPKSKFGNVKINRITVTGALLAFGWLMFEVFNFASTEFALNDALGNLKFLGIRWATILSLAFCMIDFAGIARMFTPEQGSDEPTEVWFLFGAWVLAAAMNATLTWWAVSVAISKHPPEAASVMGNGITQVVPVFVAVLVWIVRILIIGTFAMVGEGFFTVEPGPYTVKIHQPGKPPQLGQQLPSYPAQNRLPSQEYHLNPPPQQTRRNVPPPPPPPHFRHDPTYTPVYGQRPTQRPNALPPGALGDEDEFNEYRYEI